MIRAMLECVRNTNGCVNGHCYAVRVNEDGEPLWYDLVHIEEFVREWWKSTRDNSLLNALSGPYQATPWVALIHDGGVVLSPVYGVSVSPTEPLRFEIVHR
jgi:hypothetical protein